MSAVSAIRVSVTTTFANAYARSGLPHGDAAAAPLLPAPAGPASVLDARNGDALADAGNTDALGSLYALLNERSRASFAGTQGDVRTKIAAKHDAMQKEHEAMQRQRDADSGGKGLFGSLGSLVSDVAGDIVHLRIADAVSDAKDDIAAMDNPKFWHDLKIGAEIVGEVAAVVVAAAATVVTFGAAAPAVVAVAVVGVGLSAAAMAEGQLHYLEALGVPETTAHWTAFGMGAAGALMTGGAAIAASGASAGSAAGSAVRASDVAAAGSAAGGASKVVEGTADVQVAHFQSAAEGAGADARDARFQMDRADRLVRALLDHVEELSASGKRASEALRGAMETKSATLAISVNGTRV